MSTDFERGKWNAWLDRAQIIGMSLDKDLDDRLFEFIRDDTCKSRIMNAMKQGQRKWIHNRCDQLGLTSESCGVLAKQGAKKTIKDIVVTKPDGWEMPWGSATTAYVQGRKREFIVECEECGEMREGLYHYSGLGPFCEECIEADDEWRAHKWEPRCW